jgi:hypothetical protein
LFPHAGGVALSLARASSSGWARAWPADADLCAGRL